MQSLSNDNDYGKRQYEYVGYTLLKIIVVKKGM
jgi:hypothetical protein